MSDPTEECFQVRGKDFERNVLDSIRRLRDDGDFVDISLATSDNDNGITVFSGHKVVLAACSNFFKKIFHEQSAASSHPKPFIFLRGIRQEDLAAILEFVYSGEVRISSDQIDSFMTAAEEMQIKGLNRRKQSPIEPLSVSDNRKHLERDSNLVARAKNFRQSSPVRFASGTTRNTDEITEVTTPAPTPTVELEPIVKSDPDDTFTQEFEPIPEGNSNLLDFGANSNESINDFGEHENSTFDPYMYVKKLSNSGPVQAECTLCNAKFVRAISAKAHVIRTHGPAEFFECKFCNKIVRCGLNFRNHVMRAHGLNGRKLIQTYGKRVQRE